MRPTPRDTPAPAWLAIVLAAACATGSVVAGRAEAATGTDPSDASRAEWLGQSLAAADALREALVGDTLGQAAFDLSDQRIVKGAPYCADAVHETVQTLADGNRIVRSTTTRQCRDGEGRTRQEVERAGRRQVWLHDPQARESWVLDPQRKTAQRVSIPTAAGALGTEAGGAEWTARMREFRERMRDYAERMRDWARDKARTGEPPGTSPTPPTPPAELRQPSGALAAPGADPAPVVVVREVVRQRDGQGREAPQVEVRVWRVDAGEGAAATPHAGEATPRLPSMTVPPMPPLPPLPGAVSWRAQTLAPRGPGVGTSLGSREIEGVKANGERTTWTIEAGRIGNEKPIVIAREVWTSPELMLTLLSRDQDPRSGETSYRLTNLKRGEPDPALMRVPADYATTRRSPSPPLPPPAPQPPAKG